VTPLLSVVIPTRNRQTTAIACIDAALRLSPEAEVEVVVQDCSSDRSLERMIAERGSRADRVAYAHGPPTSMPDNWNRALERMRGRYVSIIGDDDAPLQGLMTSVGLMEAEGIEAMARTDNQPLYYWPNFPLAAIAGELRLRPYGGTHRIVETAATVPALWRTGDRFRELPTPYHGLVRTSVLESIRNKTGKIFDGISPDIYSSYCVALLVEKYLLVDYPVVVIGASGASNSARLASGQTLAHMDEYEAFEFTRFAPGTHISVASNTDTMVRAIENMGRMDLLDHVDFGRVFARTIWKQPNMFRQHLRKYLQQRRTRGRSALGGLFVLAGYLAARAAWGAARRLRRGRSDTGTLMRAGDMDEVIRLLSERAADFAVGAGDTECQPFPKQTA